MTPEGAPTHAGGECRFKPLRAQPGIEAAPRALGATDPRRNAETPNTANPLVECVASLQQPR